MDSLAEAWGGRLDVASAWSWWTSAALTRTMLALGRLDGLCLTREVLGHDFAQTGVRRNELEPALVARRCAALPR